MAQISFWKSEFEDVPGWDQLEPQLQEWLADPGLSLSYIYELVCDYITEQLDPEGEDDEAANNAAELAFDVIERLIWYLPVDELNCERLKAYITEVQSYDAYDRLLRHYDDYLSPEERQRILEEGKRLFIPEVTSDWE